MKSPRVLILVRKGHEYTNQMPNGTMKAGLLNSASFIKETLIKDLHIPAHLEICVDGNDVDRKIHKYKPTHCFLEAIWVTPAKLKELAYLHPKVDFVVRIHSKIPFLANEGIALQWIKEYFEIGGNVSIAFNNVHTHKDFRHIGIDNDYLPNVYKVELAYKPSILGIILDVLKDKFICFPNNTINVGCFGAIRPLKNQLLQAVAAMQYADKHDLTLRFHINGTRLEQRGEVVLKNIRALFKDTRHVLVEHSWMSHMEFLKLIKKMDIGLQLSFTESFNIVTADFVASRVPVIVGKDIEWMNKHAKCDPNNVDKVVEKMEYALRHRRLVARLNLESLINYNHISTEVWREYFLSYAIVPQQIDC